MNRAEQIIENYLKRNGITKKKKIKEIISGFDLSMPVYLEALYINDKIYQYRRNPSQFYNENGIGNWFALKSATMDSLAIFSGGSGRSSTEFKVKYSINVLAGTAKKLDRNWGWAGGGTGGATQHFIPNKMFYALEVLGTHMR